MKRIILVIVLLLVAMFVNAERIAVLEEVLKPEMMFSAKSGFP